jgi:HAD superfamily hydrolase (TIGR01484 family)
MSSKYRALILDLDGTCVKLGLGNMPTEKLVKTIHRLIKRGVPVSVASGRNITDADPVIEALGIVEPCMLTNGAILYDPKNKELLELTTIDPNDVAQICAIARKDAAKVIISTPYGEHSFQEHRSEDQVVGIFIEKLTKEQANEYVRQLEKIPTITVHTSSLSFDGVTTFVSINEVHATKQRALQHLLKRLKINPEQIVAVGDGENDLPMIIAAGMGVAMGNAADGLKSVADYIAPSVDEDGLVDVIEKFFPEG